MSDQLSANDVAKLLELAPATVLYHEKMGRLKAERMPNGMRLFDRVFVEHFRQEREKAKARR